jgi:hypothetical protein
VFVNFYCFSSFISGKLAKPRQLHNSQWGMMCPAETPEGQVNIFLFKLPIFVLAIRNFFHCGIVGVIGL